MKAFETLLESERPENVLWPLLRTWTTAVLDLTDSDPTTQDWKDACSQLGLLGDGFGERIMALDAFLEQIEETITAWERDEGA